MEKKRNVIIKESLEDKITGEATYTDDIRMDNLLHGRTLRSTIAYGKILSIHYPTLPSGYYIVDRDDIPQNNVIKIIGEDQPVFSDGTVRYIGEPIALFIGKDRDILRKLLKETVVEYQELEPILSIPDSLRGGEKNLFTEYTLERGDLTSAKMRAAYSFKESFETGVQEHVYLEPQSMVAEYADGEITIWGSLQSFFPVKEAVEYCTGYPVRVIQPSIGGGFGGKEDFPSLIACHASLGAIKSRGTVKIVYDREEDIISTTKRHPSQTSYEIFLDDNLNILGAEVDIKLEAGAYEGLSNLVLELMMAKCCGVYRVPALKVVGRTLKTNKLSFGAWRGFGAPQGNFCMETLLDIIAKRVGVSSLELKRRNLVKRGDPTTTGGSYREEVFLEEMLEEVLKRSCYYDKSKEISATDKNRVRSIGLSFSTLGGGLTGNVEKNIAKSKVRLMKRRDGKVVIYSSIVDIGQGAHITLRKIVAHVLAIPLERIIYAIPDSKNCPDSGPTVASRSILIIGKLLERAAEKLREKLTLPGEFEIVEEYRHPAGYRWEDEKHLGDANISHSFAVNVIEIEVDLISYRIYPIKYWGVYDIGTPIDPKIALGQVQGGVVQGAGYSHMEVMKFDHRGALLQKNLTDYLIPTSKDIFPVEVSFFKNRGEQGPMGAKALGELPFIGVAPAILAAVNRAFNCEIKRVPLNPEFLMEVLDEDKV